MSRKARSFVVALVLFSFAGGAAHALPRTLGIPERAEALAAAWEWVASFFAPAVDGDRAPARAKAINLGSGGAMTEAGASGGSVGGGGSDAGMIMDPNGYR